MNNTRRLGNTNIEVKAIGLGAMPLSLQGRPDETTAIAVIDAFINGGGNFIDTANVYCVDDYDVGHNEKLIARALHRLNNTADIIIATKGGLRRPKGDWTVDASPEWLRLSCEKSLKDLDIDTIFLYQLHSPDQEVPLTDSVGELARLKEEGKIQHIGLSNVTIEHIELALSVTQIMSVQNRCNLFEQKSFKNGVVKFCEDNNITFIAHSPVGGHFQHAQRANHPLLKDIADEHKASSYQIMLAWLLQKSESILPIPGASKPGSIIDSLATLDIDLDKEDIQRLNTDVKNV